MNNANVESVYPLSPLQQHLLFLALPAGGSQSLVAQRLAHYRGALDPAHLRRAWQRMVERHAVLRTVFAWKPHEEPLQLVRPSAELAWTEEDWRGRPAEEREAALERHLRADRNRGFDVTQTSPMRLCLIRSADDEHWLLLSFHPILLDDSSVAILGREVAECYGAFTRSAEPNLPAARAFQGYVEWLRAQDLAGAEQFWQRLFVGYSSAGGIGTVGRAAGDREPIEEALELEDAWLAGIHSLAREQQVKVATLLRTAWALLVSRLTGERDLAFGADCSDRAVELTGIGSMIGPFAGVLPVRMQFAEGDTFLAAAKRLQALEGELEMHRHAPLIGGRVWDGASLGIPALETLVALDDRSFEPEDWANLPGVAVDDLRSWSRTSHAIVLGICRGNRFRLRLTVDGSRLDAPAARGMLQQVRGLLDQVMARPTSLVDELSLVTSESRAVLPDPAAALAEVDLEPVTTAFESWARRTPQAAALKQHGCSMSYATLADRAHAIAHSLVARGCAPGDVVALDGWPGFGLIAGLLGTLLAGGVVLMIDRRLPVERRRVMVREADARHLVWLTTGDSASELQAERSWGAVVAVDLGSAVVNMGQGSPPAMEALPGPRGADGAYIFFTSGTTGVPKGVLGTHRGLSHFVAWQRTAFAVGPGDRSSQLTGLSFDVVLREMLLPLTSGATLCLPDEPANLGAEQVLPWLEREGITILHTVPTLAQTWLLSPPQDVSLSALRRVFFAGEPLGGHLVRRWREEFGDKAQIINLYGPTETTLAKCHYIVPPDPDEGTQPVGRPLPQSQALVLSEKQRACGVGEWGEIVIRTPYRTRGYINAPDENRRRFRQNPFRTDARDLLYHTGDRGRFRADGTLEISGRLDDQVKINGVRVEPGEIAAVLGQSPVVRQCTVLGQKSTRGVVALVAYVVPEKGAALAAADLKGYLRARLPEYMVPASFVMLEQLPMTPNGKVDRKALARLSVEAGSERVDATPPTTPVEELVASIWADVLGVERVGVEDNFFDIGGDSLLLMQVISRARARGLTLNSLTVFRYPSVRSLAAHLSASAEAVPSYQGIHDRARRQREAVARRRTAPVRG